MTREQVWLKSQHTCSSVSFSTGFINGTRPVGSKRDLDKDSVNAN